MPATAPGMAKSLLFGGGAGADRTGSVYTTIGPANTLSSDTAKAVTSIFSRQPTSSPVGTYSLSLQIGIHSSSDVFNGIRPTTSFVSSVRLSEFSFSDPIETAAVRVVHVCFKEWLFHAVLKQLYNIYLKLVIFIIY